MYDRCSFILILSLTAVFLNYKDIISKPNYLIINVLIDIQARSIWEVHNNCRNYLQALFGYVVEIFPRNQKRSS